MASLPLTPAPGSGASRFRILWRLAIEAGSIAPMNTITPPEISPAVLKFVEQFNTATAPVYVPARPSLGEPVNDCFNVVARRIASEGGSIEHGWAIWEWPTIMLEGEFHAVWLSPAGERVDIAPKPELRIGRILFLPDRSRRFEGQRVYNRRTPIRDNAAVRAFIRVSQELDEMLGTDLAPSHFVGAAADAFRDVNRRKYELVVKLHRMTPRQFRR